ncbi:6-hydroxy-d-nicotine oxidase [Colletotrichum plurivorum]|uniref:6-hydroxy-d-nicotine oxidase n=1 Tax=Colletotrichum plurivorum TaxID=2175906 RepID=A0A8H6N0B0_9PEZI|nr:6-hydroxy-d-nicotine oxidase [Colletotrichum plurivorum]
MASLEASAEFRIVSPEGSTREQIAADAPALRGLAEAHPDLLIYTLSAESYEVVRGYYNAGATQKPMAIIRPRAEAEVVAVLREVRAQNIPFDIRVGGHSINFEEAQGQDGVVLDLRALDSVAIAEDKASARVGGGIISVNLAKFLHSHGVTTPHGWCSSVGVAGWALGGGYGWSSAFYGLGVDQVLGARVVLAGGDVVDTDDHPDLLWALRGAGNGNFGIVVELRLRVYPETATLCGIIGFPDDQAVDVFTRFGELEQELPVNFSGEAVHMTFPGVGPTLAWLFVWTSEDDKLDEGWAFLEKFKALGTPLLSTVAAVADYTFFSSFPNPSGVTYESRVRTIEYLSPEVSRIIARVPPPGPDCANVVHSAHGRALQENPGACWPLRRRHRIVNPAAGVPLAQGEGPEFKAYKKWMDGVVEGLSEQGLALPYGYRNLGPEKDTDWVATYGEETLARLKEVKAKFDPENVFRTGYPRLDLL